MSSFSDDFNRANGTLGGNYTSVPSSGTIAAQILSNRVRSNNSGSAAGDWYFVNALSFDAGQTAQITLFVNASTDSYGGVLARASNAALTTYYLMGHVTGATGLELSKVVAGSFTTISSDPTNLANGDVLIFTVGPSTQAANKNGTPNFLTGSDNAIASGRPGLVVGWNPGGADGDVELDNFFTVDKQLNPWSSQGAMGALMAQ